MIKKLFKTENIFLIFCLIWGVLFLLINPPFQSPDEPEHMFKMYGYTEGSYNFKIKNGWSGQILPVSFAKLYKYYDEYRLTMGKTSLYQTKINSEIKLDKNNKTFLRYNVPAYTPLSYFPSFIVLWLLKFFNVAPVMMMYILRFCSLFTYMALCYIALKIMPCKKVLLFLLATLPLNISQAASVSTDGLVFGVCFIFLAYTLRLKFDNSIEKISGKQIILWQVLSAIICLLKFAYSPLLLLYFLIPVSKFESRKAYLKNFLMAFVINIVIISLFLFSALRFSDIRDYAYFHNNRPVSVLVKNIVAHPADYAIAMIKTTIVSFNMYVQNVISNIGISLLVIPLFGTNLYWFLLFLSVLYKPETEKDMNFCIRDKMFLSAAVIVSYIIVLTSVYLVYQTYPVILGMQGRYLTPLLPLVMLLFAFNKFHLNYKYIPWLVFVVSQFLLLLTSFIFIIRFY